ncbi:MAG: phasin family protein [Gammaproteobacteria bacterium]|nr:phasin family protein [Gammaproteobacteria bacterium]
MQNEMMNIMKQFSDSAMASAKKIGDLDMKTFETLAGKQADLVKSCVEMGSRNAEAVLKVKDLSELNALQQEVTRSCGEKWVANMREATEMLTAVRDELTSIMEEAAKYTQEGAEQAVEAGKKAATEAVAKTTEAVEKATSEVVEMTKEAAEKTVEATKKAAAKAKAA